VYVVLSCKAISAKAQDHTFCFDLAIRPVVILTIVTTESSAKDKHCLARVTLSGKKKSALIGVGQ
jgi:hypothetical protein